jgi:hypothetical protein
MNSQDRIFRALKALRQADRHREAPRVVEDRLLAAFRERQRQPRNSPWQFAAMLAAAAMIVMLVLRLYSERQGAIRVDRAMKATPVATVVERTQEPAARSRPVAVRKRNAIAVQEAPREIVTDFFPLMDVAPPLGRGQLLRVAVPASTMRSVGLPVREERLDEPVQADVLIGEEGMVRAIRFVSQRNY